MAARGVVGVTINTNTGTGSVSADVVFLGTLNGLSGFRKLAFKLTPATVLNHTHAGVNHIFEGAPDSRQSSDVTLPPSRFRPRYQALLGDEKALHDAIKSKAAELEALFEQIPAGRYLSLAFTDLESSISWSVQQLTS